MRYILNNSGYVQEVSFGADILCNGAYCTEYTGKAPSGYDDLADWFIKEGDKLYRWKIVEGHLTLDSNVAIKSEPGAVFAPSGYGLGETPPVITDANNATKSGFYRFNGFSCANIPSAWQYLYGTMIVSEGTSFVEQILLAHDKIARRTIDISTSVRGEWVDISPSAFAPAKVIVWETASRTSSFEPQTLSLDLSAYDEVLIYSCLEASRYNDHMVVSRCPIGEMALAHFTWADDSVSLHRFAKTSKTGIEFFNAYHGGAVDNASLMPYKIYGIKEVKK